MAAVDPRAILAEIASDTAAPASARVAACRELLKDAPKQPDAEDPHGPPADSLSQRAIELLKGQKRMN